MHDVLTSELRSISAGSALALLLAPLPQQSQARSEVIGSLRILGPRDTCGSSAIAAVTIDGLFISQLALGSFLEPLEAWLGLSMQQQARTHLSTSLNIVQAYGDRVALTLDEIKTLNPTGRQRAHLLYKTGPLHGVAEFLTSASHLESFARSVHGAADRLFPTA